MNIEIANRLVRLRKEKGFSQEELAAQLGLSRQAVSKWERAEASPDTDNLILLARLYNVSLDELLRTEDEIPISKPESSGFDSDNSNEKNDDGSEFTHCDNGDKVQIKNGHLHILDKDGDEVDISFQGIHVREKDGKRVDVGWNGIHVDERYKNDGEWGNYNWDNDGDYSKGAAYLRFPYPILALILFLAFGFAVSGWAWSWVFFLTIPVYYSSCNAIAKGKVPEIFFSCICIAGFFICGFMFTGWTWAWLWFLAIPLISSLFSSIRKKDANQFAYPILATIVFFVLGFGINGWAWSWISFLTIPLYYSIVNIFRRK